MSEQENVKQIEREAERKAVRRRMAVQHYVELGMNRIVQDMRDLVDQTGIVNSRMEKHQISNVLAVALETPSVEEVKTFILYQAGRDVSGTSWRRKNFGDNLAKALDDLHETARSVVGEVMRAGEPKARDIDEVWIELARRYLGQLNRYFYYRKEAARWPKS